MSLWIALGWVAVAVIFWIVEPAAAAHFIHNIGMSLIAITGGFSRLLS